MSGWGRILLPQQMHAQGVIRKEREVHETQEETLLVLRPFGRSKSDSKPYRSCHLCGNETDEVKLAPAGFSFPPYLS